MELTHFGHSCVQVTMAGSKILLDPGAFSHGFEDARGLDAILVTHQHHDHVDVDRLPALVAANPGAALYADPQTTEILGEGWTAVRAGDVFSVGDVSVTGAGGTHAVIHRDLPNVDNTAYLLGTPERPGLFFHPGDSLHVPDVDIDVLALPTAAPWMTLGDAVDYLRAIAPRIAVPIHQEVLAQDMLGIYFGLFDRLSDAATEFRTLVEKTETTL